MIGIISCSAAVAQLSPDTVSEKILAINDFHGQITTGLKVSNRPVGGAAILASYLETAAKGWENRVILVEAGDMIGASQPQCALLHDRPAIMLLNYLNSSVPVIGSVGNHELDKGLSGFRRLIGGDTESFLGNPWHGADFPLINGNIVDTENGFPVMTPFVINYVPGINVPIAFISAVLKETPAMVSATGVAGLKFVDEAKTVNYYVQLLQKLNIHAFVVLLHQGGLQTPYNGWTDTTKAQPSPDIVNLVSRFDDDVDIVCTAHTHNFTNAMVKNANGFPILVTQAYSKGTAYAEIIVTFSKTKNDIVAKKARIVTTFGDAGPGLSPDSIIVNHVRACSTIVAPLTNRIISRTAIKITASQNRAGESLLGDLIADAQRAVMRTDFAFMNPGGIRADLDSGNITWGALYTSQPFSNAMVTMTMTGQQIYDVLNEQWSGQSYIKMLQISGLSYTWDTTLAVGNRVTEVRKGSVAIDKKANYSVTVNNFLASGGDNFSTFKRGLNKVTGPIDLDVLVKYLQTLPAPISIKRDGRVKVVQ